MYILSYYLSLMLELFASIIKDINVLFVTYYLEVLQPSLDIFVLLIALFFLAGSLTITIGM